MGYSAQKSHIFDAFPTPTGTSGCLTEFGEDNVPLLSVYGDVHGPCAFCCEYSGFSSVVNPIFLHSFVLIQKEKFSSRGIRFQTLLNLIPTSQLKVWAHISGAIACWDVLLSFVFPKITIEAMKSDIDEVALQGIEFWSNVCDEEMDLAIEASEVRPEWCWKAVTARDVCLGTLKWCPGLCF